MRYLIRTTSIRATMAHNNEPGKNEGLGHDAGPLGAELQDTPVAPTPGGYFTECVYHLVR